MKDFDALKNIWHGQAELPGFSYDEVLRKVKNSRSAISNKLLLQMIALVVSTGILVTVLFRTDFTFGTSQAGLLIFIVCCIIYLAIQLRDYNRIRNSDGLLDAPDEYIAYLKSYKQKRYILNTRIYKIYMVFIGVGVALSFIEIFFYMSIWQTVAAVSLTIGWFCICYFVFMRLYIRKEEARLNEMIRNLERLRQQFRERAEAS